MSIDAQPKKRAVGTKVSEDVVKATRQEQARRELAGQPITRKDILAEWLEEKAKSVLEAG